MTCNTHKLGIGSSAARGHSIAKGSERRGFLIGVSIREDPTMASESVRRRAEEPSEKGKYGRAKVSLAIRII
jgi:hypothetical protein